MALVVEVAVLALAQAPVLALVLVLLATPLRRWRRCRRRAGVEDLPLLVVHACAPLQQSDEAIRRAIETTSLSVAVVLCGYL